ncbi:hypothetical protein [Alienimonas californiensis]|uniref:hypothetical protein n=1 Tax=Alienimonas californiensis TaxID=2527989 RepID=UPI001A97F128|nr:hypothetical protein [Alienimonas californiensis]
MPGETGARLESAKVGGAKFGAADTDVELAADPQEGDPEGKASRFVGTDPGLGVVREYEGTISGLIDGTPYTGDFKEVAHGHSEE